MLTKRDGMDDDPKQLDESLVTYLFLSSIHKLVDVPGAVGPPELGTAQRTCTYVKIMHKTSCSQSATQSGTENCIITSNYTHRATLSNLLTHKLNIFRKSIHVLSIKNAYGLCLSHRHVSLTRLGRNACTGGKLS